MYNVAKHNFQPGEIWHPVRAEETIMKCFEFLDAEIIDKSGNAEPISAYMLTNEFPKYHYVVIDQVADNYSHPEHPYCVVYLITHTNDFDNLKVTDDLYIESQINLKNSYITRDKFLIHVDNFVDKVYGRFDIGKLRDALEY